jgi:hypothetical protein
MELVAVLLICAVMAVVFYRVASRPLLPRGHDEADERGRGTRLDARNTGTSQVRRRPY